MRRKHRPPRSRQEMRAHASAHAPALLPPVPQAAAPQVPLPVAIASNCLYAPFECSVYRNHPSAWCSSCKIRASSMCAQLGYPDVRTLFSPSVYAYPSHVTCAPTCYPPTGQVYACPATHPPACPLACPSFSAHSPAHPSAFHLAFPSACPSACAPVACARPGMCPTSVYSSS